MNDEMIHGCPRYESLELHLAREKHYAEVAEYIFGDAVRDIKKRIVAPLLDEVIARCKEE